MKIHVIYFMNGTIAMSKKYRTVWWNKKDKHKHTGEWCPENKAQQAYINLMNTLADKKEWHYELEERETWD